MFCFYCDMMYFCMNSGKLVIMVVPSREYKYDNLTVVVIIDVISTVIHIHKYFCGSKQTKWIHRR